MFYCRLQSVCDAAKQKGFIDKVYDVKEFKKLLRTRTNVLVIYMKTGKMFGGTHTCIMYHVCNDVCIYLCVYDKIVCMYVGVVAIHNLSLFTMLQKVATRKPTDYGIFPTNKCVIKTMNLKSLLKLLAMKRTTALHSSYIFDLNKHFHSFGQIIEIASLKYS